MSIIFGIAKPQGDVVTEHHLLDMGHATDRWAADGTFIRRRGRIGMGFQPYHTHRRSHLESQPITDEFGNMLTLDGRLDNHQDLRELLNIHGSDIPDSRIVLAAFRRWGEKCFAMMVGDWALAIWSQVEQALYLARDHAGTRTLYFENTPEGIVWSTFLETFFVENKSRDLDETYAARYLACQPIRDLTPYKGVTAVTPAHFAVFHEGKMVRKAHWQWMVQEIIRYQTDREYEEHFLALFQQAVDRRTAFGDPVLAQLSGGMDSTAIVCMSDKVRRTWGASSNDMLDTVSYFDDSEPGWNERPYFSLVEERRGKVGFHIQNSFTDRTLQAPNASYGCQLLPGLEEAHAERERLLAEYAECLGCRVLLSGIGGDELLGGVPTPFPELADHLLALRLATLLRRSVLWGLALRLPLISLVGETIRFAWTLYRPICSPSFAPPKWVVGGARRYLKRTHDVAFSGDVSPHRPTAISNGMAWWSILETLPHIGPSVLKRYEYRYPYLDRDLVDFLFRIPREQLSCPGRRRYVMRRALKDIVPVEILERKRKALCTRSPVVLLQTRHAQIASAMRRSLTASRRLIDEIKFLAVLEEASKGADSAPPFPILRTLSFELWLRSCPPIPTA